MRNIVNEYIKQFEENRRSRRRTIGIISALALLVAFGVFWNLHFTGVAYTGDVYCGMEEHTHDDSCYAWVLSGTASEESEAEESTNGDTEAETVIAAETVSEGETAEAGEADAAAETDEAAAQTSAEAAGTDAEGAQTGDDASAEASQNTETASEEENVSAAHEDEWYLSHGYEKVLICGQEEHTHTLECISNAAADVETADDWEADLPEELDGTAAENLVAVAVSQVGYTESTANFTLAEDGVTRKGYTRYGAWYGNAYGDWNAMFAAFCLHYAGISEEDFPINSGAYAWAVDLTNAGLYKTADAYTPSAGDLIFLDTNEDKTADLVGIVETVTKNSETSDVTLTVILGDYCDESASEEGETTADAVCRVEYASDDVAILGYGIVSGDDDTEQVMSVKFTAEANGIKVEASAKEGTFPEGTTMSVTLLDADDDATQQQYKEAMAAVEESGVEYEGVVIFDISFFDEAENEIEPEDGAVSVKVTVDASLVDETVDGTSQLELYHLKESDEGLEVEMVANTNGASEGTVDVDEDGTVLAEFSAESFSTFTLVYYDNPSAKLTVYFVDTTFKEISVSGMTESESVEMTDGWQSIYSLASEYITAAGVENDGVSYNYQYACLSSSNRVEITYVKYENGKWYYSTASSEPSEGDGEIEALYLVFSKYNSAVSKVEETDPDYSKYVSDNGDGTYDLTLTVSVDETPKTAVDIVFIMDVSGSMCRALDDDYVGRGNTKAEGQERMEKAKEAITTLTNSIANNTNMDANFSLVLFAGSGLTEDYYDNHSDKAWNDAVVKLSWTDSASDLIAALPEAADYKDRYMISENYNQVGTSTNYEAGLMTSESLLKSTRTGATTVVIFISDGDPTCYYDSSGITATDVDGTNYDQTALDQAVAQLEKMYSSTEYDIDYFLTVGVGPTESYDYLKDLGDLNSTVAQHDSTYYGVTTAFYSGYDETSLKEAFDNILTIISSISPVSNVTISDTLSGNVSAFLDDTENVKLKINVVENSSKKTLYSKSGTVNGSGSITLTLSDGTVLTASYSKTDKTVTLDFPDDYQLVRGWTYSVTVTVMPTEEAYEKYYRNTNTYTDTGSENTDAPDATVNISSGIGGMFTNSSATLTYTYLKTPKERDYPMPVIPLTFADVTVIKGSSESGYYDLSGAEFILYRTDSSNVTVYYKEDDGIVSWVTDADAATALTSDDEGKIIISKLYSVAYGQYNASYVNEVYYLKETKAPDGYTLLTEIISFRIDSSTTKPIILKGTTSDGVTYADVNDDGYLVVYDTPGYELPFTGGTGTIVFTCFGMLLITSAVWFIYMKQRQRKSQIASGT